MRSGSFFKKYLTPVVAAAGVFVFGCENDLDEVKRVTEYELLPLETAHNTRIVYTDSARLQFVVSAGQIDRYSNAEKPYDEFSNGVHVISYNRKGEVESELHSKRAKNMHDEKIMVANDSVVLFNIEGKRLETEELWWDDNTGKIYTDKFVTITTKTEILYGDGLKAEEDFSKYEILNIKGRIRVEEED